MLVFSEGVFQSLFSQLRSCGRGRAECVVYGTAATATPDTVDALVHPIHVSGLSGYEVDDPWITQFFLELRASRRRVRIQIHTHPGEAFHSRTDDTFSLVPATGFLSLVIPHFGGGRLSLDSAAIYELSADGSWRERDPEEIIRW